MRRKIAVPRRLSVHQKLIRLLLLRSKHPDWHHMMLRSLMTWELKFKSLGFREVWTVKCSAAAVLEGSWGFRKWVAKQGQNRP